MNDNDIIKNWVRDLYNKLYDHKQYGCPDVSVDGKSWRYSFSPKSIRSIDMKVVQALMRRELIPELRGVKSKGNCFDCIHGHNVSSVTGLWPVIADCEGCLNPLHQHFIPLTDLYQYKSVTMRNVFVIPVGGTTSTYISRIKAGKEGKNWLYYCSNGFVHLTESGQRICHNSSIGKLHLPAHKRGL
jgi:hypothetical protein